MTEDKRMSDRLESDVKEALDVAYKADRKIDSHEDICSLRYKGIQMGMATITGDIQTLAARMWIASGSVIAACMAVIITLLAKG